MKTHDEKYNGWTNYETWRVKLEIFDCIDREDWEDVTPDQCQDYAEEMVSYDMEESIAKDFALAFMEPVNWQEIANAISEA